MELAALARESADALEREHRIGGVADVRFDHGRVDPRSARPKARLALSFGDHDPGDLLHNRGAQPPSELSDRRLVRHALVDRDQTEPPQMQRVRDLPDERFVAPAGACLDHHQPHEHRHRDRRPAAIARRALPHRRDRRQQHRVGQDPIQSRQIVGQLAHLDRQHLVPQRLHLPTTERQHHTSTSRESHT